MKDKEERIARAVAYFKEGYNCSQSVVAAFADLYGFTHEQALHISASFGGGRLTCGAACGMFQLVGLEVAAMEGKDRETKSRNYAIVQELAARFKAENGSITCGELLGLKRAAPVSNQAEARTAAYYAKRPCPKMVESAARIFADYLASIGR